ncbi:MAG: pyridoxal phosphate-dependent aminotransferase [Clostridia bacterium]|nr:pyridoxal phosphate-dependent aminotransferase [Clostridia bacterium]
MTNPVMLQHGKTKSAIRELFEYGLRQAAIVGKENVYDYSLGNPSVPAPAEIADTIRELMSMEPLALHGYTPASGAKEAREAVAADLRRRTGDDIGPENLFFTCGAAPALISVMRALAVEGAEILLLAPYFSEYPVFASTNGLKPVVVPADTSDFQLHADQVEPYITPSTQAVIVNSPNNPSGVVYNRKALEELGALLTRKSAEIGHPIYIIADEPYRELTYDGEDAPYIPAIYPNTVICYSYSKSLSMPGERIGYVCVPNCAADSAELYAAVAGAARSLGHVCAPSLMQRVISLSTKLRPDIASYDRNRMRLYMELSDMGYRCVKPRGAFYMLVEAPDGDSEGFSEKAKELNLLLVPADGFGCPGFVRLSTCVSYDMILRSLPAFRKLMASYQK